MLVGALRAPGYRRPMSDDHDHSPDLVDGGADDAADDADAELQALLDERRAASPRKTADREPVGTDTTKRLIAVTTAAIALSTIVLLIALLAG